MAKNGELLTKNEGNFCRKTAIFFRKTAKNGEKRRIFFRTFSPFFDKISPFFAVFRKKFAVFRQKFRRFSTKNSPFFGKKFAFFREKIRRFSLFHYQVFCALTTACSGDGVPSHLKWEGTPSPEQAVASPPSSAWQGFLGPLVTMLLWIRLDLRQWCWENLISWWTCPGQKD